MAGPPNDVSLLYFVSACSYLFLKMFANSGVQAYARFQGLGFKYPEDQVLKLERTPDPALQDLETRATAAWRNDLENIPMFCFAALCGLLVGLPSLGYGLILAAYCLCRTLHTVCLLLALQPWRFIVFVSSVSLKSSLFLWSLWVAGLR